MVARTDRDAQQRLDLTACARKLMQDTLIRREDDADWFRLIRRHEAELDRWFSQRLGYRLHIGADTIRLYKNTVVPHRRPLLTAGKGRSSSRPLSAREYTLLCLVLAAVAAGPRIISLRDLILRLREAAGDAGIPLREEPSERRALIVAVEWMIGQGLVRELHEKVERYINDAEADAIIEVVPERVALLPLQTLGSAETSAELLQRPQRRLDVRQWMRARLAEDGVLYRDDLDPEEWRELRRRLGEESDLLGEMLGLHLEVRAEGVAAIDPQAELTDRTMPAGGTVGHAALLLLERLCAEQFDRAPKPGCSESDAIPFDGAEGSVTVAIDATLVSGDRVVELVAELTTENTHWSQLATEPERLTRAVLSVLADHRLIDLVGDGGTIRVRPMAHRFAVEQRHEESGEAHGGEAGTWSSAGESSDTQGSLW